MAFLFNKEKNKYIELNLFTTNEKVGSHIVCVVEIYINKQGKSCLD